MLDAYQDLIDELLGTPTEIRGLVDGAGAAETSPAARQIIGEIRDRDRAVLGRVQAFIRQEAPYLRAIASGPEDHDEDIGVLLTEMEQARGDLVSLLINMSLKDWSRTAIDETEGEVTLADEIERHVEFDEAHRSRFSEAMASA
jgi:hypothetical protein